MNRFRACFLGTPEFAVVSLRELLKDEQFDIVGVVTQPDRPAGRQLRLTPSPVKTLALEKGLTVLSPEKVRSNEILDTIRSWRADVAIVVAFGQILPQSFLDLFSFGAVNVHGSILPRWRGAAPIQRAIEAGDTETGVTLQKMVKELDAGDVFGSRKVLIDDQVTAMELQGQLAVLGAELLRVELPAYLRREVQLQPQDPDLVTFAKKIDKAECEIQWSRPSRSIHNCVRAFTMGPGAFANFQTKKIKIHRTELVSISDPPKGMLGADRAGRVWSKEGALYAQTGDGLLRLLEVQPESRSRMRAEDFIRGQGGVVDAHFE